MNRRILYRVAGAVFLAAGAVYLFSLFPKSTTPRWVYHFAPVLVVGAVGYCVEAILLRRRPDLEYFRRHPGTYGELLPPSAHHSLLGN